MSFVNATPFAAIDVPMRDRVGRQVVVAIVKATYTVVRPDRLVLADAPAEVRLADVLRDDQSAYSSPLYPSDLCTDKLGTDVVVVGEAVSRKPVVHVDVAIRVRQSTFPIRVHGYREYFRGLLEVAISAPVPFERMPIDFERAYGGCSDDLSIVDLRNPAGVGVARQDAQLIGTRAPQIEHPTVPHKTSKDRHPPVGCGAVLPHWSPRRERAGTFDEIWQATRMPLMPDDFDLRHHSVAAPGLSFESPLAAGDSISVLNMTLPELFAFTLPSLPINLRARYDDRDEEVRPSIDTVLIEPGKARVEVVLRRAFSVGRGRSRLREVRATLDG
jgi:hypothetical protein